MPIIKSFDDFQTAIVSKRSGCPRVAVVRGTDEATLQAIKQLSENGIAMPICINSANPEEDAAEAVAMVNRGEADMIMKGLINTDVLLHAILDKQKGLVSSGQILTHISAASVSTYPKVFFFTDAAVIPYPTQEQRTEQVRYSVQICHRLGISEPRIALIHCSEKPSRQFPFVDGYNSIIEHSKRGAFGSCIVDGPLDVKTACSLDAQMKKNINSPINGEADVLIMPDIEAGNIFYKSLTFFAKAKTAGMLCGAKVPIIIPSRGDNAEAKYNSILFGLATI